MIKMDLDQIYRIETPVLASKAGSLLVWSILDRHVMHLVNSRWRRGVFLLGLNPEEEGDGVSKALWDR